MKHDTLEKNSFLFGIFITVVVSIGGLVEIVPLYFLKDTVPPLEGVKPYEPLALKGKDIFMREGCVSCHSQQLRPFRAETERYGDYSKPAESMYDFPHLWGSKRTGPDLARVGGKYPDSWHVQHMRDPQSMVPVSVMPKYPWLEKRALDGSDVQAQMRALQRVGVPYSQAEVDGAPARVAGKTELDALIAYLQGLGTAVKE